MHELDHPEHTTLQKATAVMAAGALLFGFLAWRDASAARERAEAAYHAASSIHVPDATHGVRELTAAMVEAGIIPDPEIQLLAGMSPDEALHEFCSNAVDRIDPSHANEAEGAGDGDAAAEDPDVADGSVVIRIAATTFEDARRTLDVLRRREGLVHRVDRLLLIAEHADLELPPEAPAVLAAIRDAWASDVWLGEAWEPIEADPAARALDTWLETNCLT